MTLATTSVAAYSVAKAGATLEPWSFDLPALGPNDVDVRVTHCGVCHSDIAFINNDFQWTTFPLVPGHEVVGHVERVGSSVTSLKVGERVGVGWQSGSCGKCEWCLAGKEHLCAQEQNTIVGRHGGWASMIRVDARFAIPIPKEIESAFAGPLMCAGVTVHAPLMHNNVQKGMRTAVVGVGGLGHLAVQFMTKMGCEVTAISSSHDKDAEAREMGATHFIATRGSDELSKAANSFDFILSTVGADLPWAEYANALRPEGALCIVGIPPHEIALPPFAIIQREKKLIGGRAGSPSDIRAMLDFAARHNVRPLIEKFPMSDVNTAVARAASGKVRYRAVLEQ